MFWGKKDRKQKKTSGQALVEFALMVALFLIFLLALIDLGRAWFTMVAVQNAAGEGSLFAMSNPFCITSGDCPDPDNVEWRAENESNSTLIDPSKMLVEVELQDPTAQPGTMITVTVTYDFEPLLPALSAFGADVIKIGRSAIQLIP